MSNPDTIGSGRPEARPQSRTIPAPNHPLPLWKRIDRALWNLETIAQLLEADLPPASGQARLVQARWRAARALLIELAQEHGGAPREVGNWVTRYEPEAETALIGALVRRHGWRAVRPGALVRSEGRVDG